MSFEYPAQADGQLQDVQLVQLRRVSLLTRLEGSATRLISLGRAMPRAWGQKPASAAPACVAGSADSQQHISHDRSRCSPQQQLTGEHGLQHASTQAAAEMHRVSKPPARGTALLLSLNKQAWASG